MTQDKPTIKIKVELPTTSELFKKHFPHVYGGVGIWIFHPNVESFFEELNQVCLIEDALKTITQTYKQ